MSVPKWLSCLTSENASLPLCESFRHVSWMTPMGAEDGLRMLAARDGCRRIAPRSLMEAPTAKLEIGES